MEPDLEMKVFIFLALVIGLLVGLYVLRLSYNYLMREQGNAHQSSHYAQRSWAKLWSADPEDGTQRGGTGSSIVKMFA